MPKITCLPNGPYLIDGPADVLDAAGRAFDVGTRPKIALCRCGHSASKPFCDGKHKSSGFQADDVAPRR
jgi:CDGSH iron-sulfur domain-containing protein 3